MADTEVSESGRDGATCEILCPRFIPILLKTLAVLGCGFVLITMILPAVHRNAEGRRRSQCRHNLHLVAFALHNYETEYGALPPAFTVDANGQRLHSWRTLILPYLNQRQLYDRIDLSKPWDDPANAEARGVKVPEYHCPSDSCPPQRTTYLANIALGGCFRLTEPRLLSEITDGAFNTVMVIEVPSEKAVPWMSPQDADETLIMSMGREARTAHSGCAHAALCDGSVRFLSATLPAATCRALFTIAGGEEVRDY
jgi:hypothetical protein